MTDPAEKQRDPSPWKTRPRVNNWDKLNDDLHDYGLEFERWGKDVLSELDALKKAIGGAGTGGTTSGENGGGTGSGPADATQPPPPPFKKP